MPSKSYLVAGGSSGIGREIAVQLAGMGHNVYVTSRRADYDPGHPNIHAFRFVSSEESMSVTALPERLQGLVYCPGTITLKSFHRLTDDDYRTDWDVNVLGAVRVIRACFDKLKKSEGRASIVLFSTVAAQTGMPLHVSIAAAKGAVEGMTKALAAEFSPEVRVNAIAPSLTDTPLTASLLKSEKHVAAASARHPLKSIGRAQDVAALAVYVLSEQADWITGQIFTIDGGLSAIRILA